MQSGERASQNLLLGVLATGGGLAFGSAFLGRYLSFRDAWAVARSCKAGHLAMLHNASYLRYYVSQLIARMATRQPHPPCQRLDMPVMTRDELESLKAEYYPLTRLPVMANVRLSDFYDAWCTHPRRNDDVDHHFVPNAHDNDSLVGSPVFQLSMLVRHFDAARGATCPPDPPGDPPVMRDWLRERECCLPSCSTAAQKRKRWQWAHNLSEVLVSWAAGQGGCIGNWKPGAWMHDVLRVLVHTVDLEGSVFEAYINDPRYLGFVRPTYYGSRPHSRGRRKLPALDFWLLVNDMYANHRRPYCTFDDGGFPVFVANNGAYEYERFTSASPATRGGIFAANATVFRQMYASHKEAAVVAINRQQQQHYWLPLERGDRLALEQLHRRTIACGGTRGHVEIRRQLSCRRPNVFRERRHKPECTRPNCRCASTFEWSLVIHYGTTVPHPVLVAVAERVGKQEWRLWPVWSEWTKWAPVLAQSGVFSVSVNISNANF